MYWSMIKTCSQGHPSRTAPPARLYVPHTAQAQIPQRRQKSHPRSPRRHISMRGNRAGVGERQPGRGLASFRVSRATCSHHHHLSSFFFFWWSALFAATLSQGLFLREHIRVENAPSAYLHKQHHRHYHPGPILPKTHRLVLVMLPY
jgi:hypothetical protein